MELNKSNMKRVMILIVFAILMLGIVQNINIVFSVFSKIFSIFFPFLLGLCIAFVLNVPTNLFEKKVFKTEQIKSKKKKRVIRMVSILLSLLLLFIIIGFVLFLVVPDFVSSISNLANNLPGVFRNITEWFTNLMAKYPDVQLQINAIDWDGVGKTIIEFIKNSANGVVSSSISFITSFISGIISLIMGIVFSVYILSQKETLGKQVRKVMKAYFPEKINKKIVEIISISNNTFNKFISGQCLEACILGVMFFITMSIFQFPHTLAIAALVTVTALIPIFGAMIAMVFGAILIAVNDPLQAVWFIIIFQIIQQIEGNFIYPKVVGKSVGLPALWVMLAVMVGGNAFGLIGMLISVPISSILYTVFKLAVNNRLKKIES